MTNTRVMRVAEALALAKAAGGRREAYLLDAIGRFMDEATLREAVVAAGALGEERDTAIVGLASRYAELGRSRDVSVRSSHDGLTAGRCGGRRGVRAPAVRE